MAESLYRKYRPQIFEDVVGQEHIERTIKNAIEQDKVSHAYLFTGPRGTGKTTTARLLAKALLCEKAPTPEPDGSCDDCRMIAAGEHPDVYELDAASRTGVENVREEIIGRVQFAPTRGGCKVYIIDEVHMLSTAAFNALLKTLEEPPSHVVFILCTTDPQKVPETIHSRCQRFDFRRISSESIVSRLGAICVSEGVEFEGEALDLIAHRAEGGMRNALTSLEQLIAFGEGKVTLETAERLLGGLDTSDLAEIVAAIGQRDAATCFRWTADYVETGADLAQFTRDLAEHVRNMYVLCLTDADVALEVSDATRRQLTHELQWFGPDRLARLLGVLGELSAELKTSTNPRLSFEIALTRMVRPDSDLTLAALAERIEALESGHSAAAHVMGGGSPASSAAVEVRTETVSTPFREPDPARADGRVSTPAPAPEDVSAGESSPAASAVRASAGLSESLGNPAALQRLWQAALTALKKNKAAYGVLFLNTKAVYDAASGMLAIEFPAENSFAFKAVQKPDVQDAVSLALQQACGEAPAFHYTQAQGAGSTPKAAEASASSRPPSASVAPPRVSPVAFAAPEPDLPPVDAYDVPPYEDESLPEDGFSAPSAPSRLGHDPAPQARRTSEASPPGGASHSPEPDGDLHAALAAGFGDGVVVEEVR